ncbi:hypothetical protein F384_07885 [Citrobacter amalonaticus Y19]|uniref:Uncharacterized protein n=1 Tax=Citrobacter amalonaticus Y19 TaxID=1261127 RepID=A0A0F6REV4_CITAM|nr:hypothetical protein F384_07885 [Citrobacter amalonaticus Y19]
MMKHINDQVLVLHQGAVVERESTTNVLASPLHELSKRLIAGHFGEILTAYAWRKNGDKTYSSRISLAQSWTEGNIGRVR